MRAKKYAHLSLDALFHRFGIPHIMVPDNAGEISRGEFQKKLRRAGCIVSPVEAYTPNQNKAESAIRELKRAYRRHMRATGCPMAYWDYCMEHVANIRSHIAVPNNYHLGDTTPQCLLTGDTPDISHLVEFAFYDFVWFWDPGQTTIEKRRLGKYMGSTRDVGEVMCANVLTDKGMVIGKTLLWPITDEERRSEVV